MRPAVPAVPVLEHADRDPAQRRCRHRAPAGPVDVPQVGELLDGDRDDHRESGAPGHGGGHVLLGLGRRSHRGGADCPVAPRDRPRVRQAPPRDRDDPRQFRLRRLVRRARGQQPGHLPQVVRDLVQAVADRRPQVRGRPQPLGDHGQFGQPCPGGVQPADGGEELEHDEHEHRVVDQLGPGVEDEGGLRLQHPVVAHQRGGSRGHQPPGERGRQGHEDRDGQD